MFFLRFAQLVQNQFCEPIPSSILPEDD